MSSIASLLDVTNAYSTNSSTSSSQSSSSVFSDSMQAALTNEQPRTRTDTGSQAVKDFLAYARMSPAERMFSSWLHGQKMTQEQFDALPAAEQAKIREQFEQALRQKMGAQSGTSATAATTSS